MTLLAVYETPSERKQRRNKLEGGRPGWCPRCALISQLRQHFFCFYGHLYGPVFGTLNQGPEGASKQDPRQRASPATPRADTTSSGDQDNPSVPPSPGGCPPDTQIWGGQGIPEHSSKSAYPGPLGSPDWAAATRKQGWGQGSPTTSKQPPSGRSESPVPKPSKVG